MSKLRSQSGLITAGSGSIITSTTAPSAVSLGQRWFNPTTAVTYQRTANADGTLFWLDVSSGGIGTSAARGVDFVGDIDPHKASATTGNGLVVGSVYYNRENNRHFVCTTATNGANVWSGRHSGTGGIITDYLLSSVYYRVHSFLNSGIFTMDGTTSCDILVVAGGGGGGGAYDSGSSGGGAGGFRFSAGLSVASDAYEIIIGAGGEGGDATGGGGGGKRGGFGGNSSFGSIAALLSTGGGGGGAYNVGTAGGAGGSGGGGAYGAAAGAASPTTSPVQGYVGGSGAGNGGSGGGGAGAVGVNGTVTNAGAGGVGVANVYRTGSQVYYAGGGGGGIYGNNTVGAGGTGGGGAGNKNGAGNGVAGTVNTGGGGGGTGGGTGKFLGGKGGSGIVIIRYPL